MQRNLITVENVRGYVGENGVAYLNLEDVARGLGWTRIANSGNEVVLWARLEKYLEDISYTQVCTERKDGFIPENIFYKLCMKANNETARKFQDLVCDEILPSIRKNGIYATDNTIEKMINDPDFAIGLLTKLKEERAEKKRLEELNRQQSLKIEQDKPKVDFVDDIMEEDKYFDGSELAKMLNIKGFGRNKLMQYMRENNILNDYNAPYQQWVSNGCAKQIPVVTNVGVRMKTLFSLRMVAYLNKKLKKLCTK